MEIRATTVHRPRGSDELVTGPRSIALGAGRVPIVTGALGAAPSWTDSPPAGTSPAPSGPASGGGGGFDAAPLAQNELWDHFDGTNGAAPDTRLWQRDTVNQGGAQVYDPARCFLDGSSHCVLEATRPGGTGTTIFAGRFTGRQKFNMQYGWMAAKIKFANSTGTVGRSWFPAFWTYHADNPIFSSWGEFDLMEIFGDSGRYSTHIYFGDTGNSAIGDIAVPGGGTHVSNQSVNYHVYWMLWEPERIRVGVDEIQLVDLNRNNIPTGPSSWDNHKQPHYFIVNFAVWPGFLPAPLQTDFPAQILVDWIWYKPLNLF